MLPIQNIEIHSISLTTVFEQINKVR